MPTLRLSSLAGLLIAGTSLMGTAQAATSDHPGRQVDGMAILDLHPVPSWTERMIPLMPPAPIAKETTLASAGRVMHGQASWYGPGFYGNRTASGEVFRPGTLTAAHRSLPFGTRVRVTNLWNGRSTVVRINDRGPFHGGRVIDLAHGAASELGLTSSGVADVRLEVLP
jgi:rare lipoprotein A